jgi:hypothetical protein
VVPAVADGRRIAEAIGLLLCWPLARLALVPYPIVWLPFRLVGIAVGAVLRLLTAIVLLPVRVLRGQGRARAG